MSSPIESITWSLGWPRGCGASRAWRVFDCSPTSSADSEDWSKFSRFHSSNERKPSSVVVTSVSCPDADEAAVAGWKDSVASWSDDNSLPAVGMSVFGVSGTDWFEDRVSMREVTVVVTTENGLERPVSAKEGLACLHIRVLHTICYNSNWNIREVFTHPIFKNYNTMTASTSALWFY